MKILQLKNLLARYDAEKPFYRNLNELPQISLLRQFIDSKKNTEGMIDDEQDVNYLEFFNFASKMAILYDETYLNSGRKSATIFNQWINEIQLAISNFTDKILNHDEYETKFDYTSIKGSSLFESLNLPAALAQVQFSQLSPEDKNLPFNCWSHASASTFFKNTLPSYTSDSLKQTAFIKLAELIAKQNFALENLRELPKGLINELEETLNKSTATMVKKLN